MGNLKLSSNIDARLIRIYNRSCIPTQAQRYGNIVPFPRYKKSGYYKGSHWVRLALSSVLQRVGGKEDTIYYTFCIRRPTKEEWAYADTYSSIESIPHHRVRVVESYIWKDV